MKTVLYDWHKAIFVRPNASRIFVQESVIKISVMVAPQNGKIKTLTRLEGIFQSLKLQCAFRGET
jgi:hypothetical protein